MSDILVLVESGQMVAVDHLGAGLTGFIKTATVGTRPQRNCGRNDAEMRQKAVRPAAMET
jgi:hypothetical protein